MEITRRLRAGPQRSADVRRAAPVDRRPGRSGDGQPPVRPISTRSARKSSSFFPARLPRREAGHCRTRTDVLEVHGLERRPEAATRRRGGRGGEVAGLKFDAGLGWITGPQRYGGRELSAAYRAPLLRSASRPSMSLPDVTPLNVGTKMLSAAILGHGSELLRQEILPALHRGDLIGCQLFSEPDAGSDLAAVRSSATWTRGHGSCAGEKVWASKAQFSDLGLCIARTEAAEDPHDGLTMFLVDMHAPGVEVRPLRQMNGHASFNQVVSRSRTCARFRPSGRRSVKVGQWSGRR